MIEPWKITGEAKKGRVHSRSFSRRDCRDWVITHYEFYDTLAPELHDLGIIVEPDSRYSWFMCEAHDVKCRDETLVNFAMAVDITSKKMSVTHWSAPSAEE